MSKPLHPSTNPEFLVKIGFIRFWATGSRKSTIKKIKKQRKNIGKIYSPSGKFVKRAKQK